MNGTSRMFLQEVERERKRQKLSKTRMAIHLGVSRPYLTQLLNGHGVSSITFVTREKLAAVLGVKFEAHLVKGAE